MRYPERLNILDLPSLEYRRERSDLIQTYKLVKGIDITSKRILKKLKNEEQGDILINSSKQDSEAIQDQITPVVLVQLDP